jgi:hypothetical protein
MPSGLKILASLTLSGFSAVEERFIRNHRSPLINISLKITYIPLGIIARQAGLINPACRNCLSRISMKTQALPA